MNLRSHLDQLITRWRSEGIEIYAPAPSEDVVRIFDSLGFKATVDVIEMFGMLSGMSEMDNEYWLMWSLRDLQERGREAPGIEGVVFSDYCMGCYQYYVKPVSHETSEVWVFGFDYGPPVRIASSLEEFFENYIANPDLVLDAPSRLAPLLPTSDA